MDSPQISPYFPFLRLPLEIRRCIYGHLIHTATKPWYTLPLSGSGNRRDQGDRYHLQISLNVVSSNSTSLKYQNLAFPSELLYSSTQIHLEFSEQIQILARSLHFQADFVAMSGKDEVECIIAFIDERPWIKENIQRVSLGLKKNPVDQLEQLLFHDSLPDFPGKELGTWLEMDASFRKLGHVDATAELFKWESFPRLQSIYIFAHDSHLTKIWRYSIASLGSLISLDSKDVPETDDGEKIEYGKSKRQVNVWVLAGNRELLSIRGWDFHTQVWERLVAEGKSRSVRALGRSDRTWAEFDGKYENVNVFVIRLGDMVKWVGNTKIWTG